MTAPGLIRRTAYSLRHDRSVLVDEEWDPLVPGCPVVVEGSPRVRIRRAYTQLQFAYLPPDLVVEPEPQPPGDPHERRVPGEPPVQALGARAG